MKKKITMLLLMSSLVLGLVACGNEAAPDPVNTPAPTVEATAEPTIEPTEAPTPEPTVAPTPEPTVEPTPEPEAELPEDRAWIDDLYNKIIALDVNGVIEILNDPELEEKATPYEYPAFSMWDYETGYKLLTTDGTVVGLATYSNTGARFAFITERTDTRNGFNELYNGDICIYTNDGVGYFDGRYDHQPEGTTYDNGEDPDELWWVWHM